MASLDMKRLRKRAALAVAALLALSAGECPSADVRDRFNAQLDEADAAAADAGLPLADPAKGDVLVLGGDLTSALATAKTGEIEFFDAKKKAFARTGKLVDNRITREAVVLDAGRLDGQTFLAGGVSGQARIKGAKLTIVGKATAKAEAFDPDKEKSSKISAALGVARVGHTETLLNDGRVLIAGGFDGDGRPLLSTEVFDPRTRKFTTTGGLKQSRALHSATLLKDGTVLIAGGISTTTGATNGTGEVYDPETDETTFTTTMMQSPNGAIRLAGHTATLISGCKCPDEGKVFIAGGFEGFTFSEQALETATTASMLYDPATRAFVATGVPQMAEDRMLHTATALGGGKVLLAGGIYGQGFFGGKEVRGVFGGVANSAEIYDAKTGKMACVGGRKGQMCNATMKNSRVMHAAVLLRSGPQKGKVLLLGGAGAKGRTEGGKGAPLKSAELFDPKKETFAAVGAMGAARVFPAVAETP